MTIALIGFAAVLILAFMRMPLGVALGLVGLVGFSELSSYRAGMANAARRRALVHPYGSDGGPRRHGAGTLPRGLRLFGP